MSNYDNTNRGVLFINDRKESDNHPDRKGSINIEGKEYWLSSWEKQSKDGKKIMTLSATAKDAATEPAPAAKRDPFLDDQNDPFA